MKKLIILRGLSGSGKSTLVKQLNADHHCLSMDKIRLVLQGCELNSAGHWTISQENNEEVYSLFLKWTDRRMNLGEFLVLESTFLDKNILDQIKEMAEKKGYSIALVDLTSIPLDQVVKQNNQREHGQRLKEHVIYKQKEKTVVLNPKDWINHTILTWNEQEGYEGLIQKIKEWTAEKVHDLSSFKKVIHIGDIQGCFSVLNAPGGVIETWDPESFYIFSGDLLDRGIENGEVMKWVLTQSERYDNMVFVHGNHENHLVNYVNREKIRSSEFKENTLPQLKEAGITAERLEPWIKKLKPLFLYERKGVKVAVNHAGLSNIPPAMETHDPSWHRLNVQQLTKGVGYYSTDIDKIYQEKMEEIPETDRWIQVHGHRSIKENASTRYSINLEGKVEFGGWLRVAELDDNGWTLKSFQNKVFKDELWREKFNQYKNEGKEMDFQKETTDVRGVIPEWIKEDASSTIMKESKALFHHEGVKVKTMTKEPHIQSFNFTKDVFFSKKWDDVVVKARGFLFNKNTHEIIARGYNKFFYVGEVAETKVDVLKQNLKFPLIAYCKENGYLGNLGYDVQTDELVIASKSGTDGTFAEWFKEILTSTMSEFDLLDLKRFLKKAEASMVFEVIDPIRDPHMIAYDKPQLILLDVFHRSEDGKKLPYEDLKKVGEAFGLKVKDKMLTIHSMEQLEGWMKNAQKDFHYKFNKKHIEGVVFEDQNGFHLKYKLPYYSFWKKMRGQKDRLIKWMEQEDTLKEVRAINPKAHQQEWDNLQEKKEKWANKSTHPMEEAFLKWCLTLDKTTLNQSIIALETLFNEKVGIKPEWLDHAPVEFDPFKPEKLNTNSQEQNVQDSVRKMKLK